MPSAFDFSASPFDTLDGDEQQRVRQAVDPARFREHEVIVDAGAEVDWLYIMVEGHVAQYDGDERVASFGPNDCFDGRSLIAGRASSRFVATEEVIAHRLAREIVIELISRNARFGALMFSDLSRKLGALAGRHGQREAQALTMARVDEAFLRPAHEVDGGADIITVARRMREHRTSSVLVRDGDRLGIFTNAGLQRAVASGEPLDRLPVREQATFDLVTIDSRALLFDALPLMISHQVHRLVVRRGEAIVGLLEQLDLLSFLSNHSYLITVQIVQAGDLPSLRAAADRIAGLVGLLHRGGTGVAQIGRLVQVLNAKLFERTWQLVAPAGLVDSSCLFVMGSEGRGEQLLRTDQDNGLVIADDAPFDDADIAAACDRFSQALADFGYPPCPGGIMVSRPGWRKRRTAFAAMVRQWLLQPDPNRLMALAIFIDAHPVAGDRRLLVELRASLDGLVSADDAMLGRFAAAIDAFPSEIGGWWHRLLTIGADSRQALDLKKAGIFPLVHGVRALALRERVHETGTAARLQALAAAGRLTPALATDLTDSLHFLMSLKLKAGLRELELGAPVTGAVATERLSSLERDLLKDALAAVRRFKSLVRHQFHLADA